MVKISRDAIVKDVYKSVDDGWCIATTVHRHLKIRYIHLKNKPMIDGKEVVKGMTVRKGQEIW